MSFFCFTKVDQHCQERAMSKESGEETRKPMIKVVYFDEQSASDYLDITAGGKSRDHQREVRERTRDMHSKVETQLAAKFSWLPFVGASAQVGAGIDVASVGQSILSKTLSNTILTDYLAEVSSDSRVRVLEGLSVTAPKDSAAYVKMYTPYMIIARTEDSGLDIARMDEAFERAKATTIFSARTTKVTSVCCVSTSARSATTTVWRTSGGCAWSTTVCASARRPRQISP